MGITIENVDVTMGEVAVNLNEEVVLKRKRSVESSSGFNDVMQSRDDSMATDKFSKNQKALAAFSKYAMIFPEKVMSFDAFPTFFFYFVRDIWATKMEDMIKLRN